MAGHSKWANIKHAKAKTDAKRGKIFTKHIRAITVAARAGGADIDANAQLRLVVDKALNSNMPKDTIQRAIKRGAGIDETSQLVHIRYEGYGPGGVAVMVDCLTDNRNRTVAEVRHALTKCGGNLGTDGSVAYLFTQQGIITFPPNSQEEKILEIALENGAEDVQTHDDGSIDVITTPTAFAAVRNAMHLAHLNPASAEVTMIAANEVSLETTEQAEKMLQLIEWLEDLDDVQEVYSNESIPDEVYEKL